MTSSGKEILPYARKIVSDFEEIQQKIHAMHGIQSGIVRIGTFSSVAINWLPDMILKRIPYRIAIRSFENPYYRKIGLVMKDRKKLTPATQMFIEYLRKALAVT